jgi:glyoxalase/bleomycin resistance protein/dioxygenase superfamily protein
MIRGIHGLFYSSDPEATRAFFRDRVRLPGSDIGEGWWIFDLPEGDLGVHPVEEDGDAGTHDVSFYCDEIQRTVADLESRGVRFTGPVADHGYGLVTYFEAPGGLRVQLYEPRYQKRGASKRSGKQKRSGSSLRRSGGARRGTSGRSKGPSRRRSAARKR